MEISPRAEQILTALKKNYREERLHHAYLFTGPAGTGKLETALRFAAYLFAPEGEEAMLARLRRNAHPDLTTLEATDGLIRVEDVRELPKILSYPPLEGTRQVVLLKEAQNLNAQAANAILKVLEEPPSHTLFLLLTPDADLLLQTIRSRCQLVRFFPLPETDFLSDAALQETRQNARKALLSLWQASPRVPYDALRTLESFSAKEQALVALDTWYSLIRDLAFALQGGDTFYHEDSRAELTALSQKIRENKVSLERVSRSLGDKCSHLHRLRVGFDVHVNQKLALESALASLQISLS